MKADEEDIAADAVGTARVGYVAGVVSGFLVYHYISKTLGHIGHDANWSMPSSIVALACSCLARHA